MKCDLFKSLACGLFLLSFASAQDSLKNKRICRACGELSDLIDERMKKTAANPRKIEVAGRIGPDGAPIPGRKINYLTSEARFEDVFADVCENMSHNQRSGCYAIINENEESIRDWYLLNPESSFVQGFCYQYMPGCTREVHEASLTDIELENYEEDKDKIDDDFMPEAKEENVKKEESMANEIIETAKDFRDDVLDVVENFDTLARNWITKNVLKNPVLEPYIKRHLAQEHEEFLLKRWYFAFISILIAIFLPIVYISLLACSLPRRIRSSRQAETAPLQTKALKKLSKKGGRASKSLSKELTESESDTVEADDEKVENVSRISKRISSRSKSNGSN